MERFLNRFYNIIDKIGKHNFILIIFILIAFISTGLFQTFSLYTESEGLSIIDGIKTYSFILNNSNTTNSVTIAPGNSKYIDITVSNVSETNLKYGIYYSTTNDLTYVHIGYLDSTKYLPNGVILNNTDYVVTIKVYNLSSSNVTITFGVKYGFENGGDLVLEDGQHWMEKFKTLSNVPNLDGGNLIPVYFDETEGTYGSWMKADSTNLNNSWYDYENKMWANAVIVDSTKKSTYQNAAVDTPIVDADIIAFYVWIPRYKYRVWNLNRQGITEDTSATAKNTIYAYTAYSTGIEIEWEGSTASTGNVKCTYNIKSAEDAANLSDTCVYNGTDTITTTSLNTDYTDAWYTHPAFTFGDGTDKEKTGFWIGKFETGNTADVPKVLPNISSLRSQTVSNQFMTAVKFQSYLSSNIDAHMLTNLEWGAVTYLMHSNYGLCNGTSCQGLYINNSYGTSCYFTGRSGGAIAGHTDLNLANAYPSNSTSTTKYNCNGYYDYKGYKLDYNTGEPTTKDITKVASTTGNITGVYDMSGGAYEYVMGNMVNSSYAFYPSSAETAWEGTSWYDTAKSALYSQYYNAYSYGTNYYQVLAFNRARLGDATAEVLGSSTSTTGSWKIGSGKTGSYSYFVNSAYSWFVRGGYSNNTNAGPFNFNRYGGFSDSNSSFRSSLS